MGSEGYMLGRAGVHRGTIIKAIGKTETPNIYAFEAAFRELPNDARVPIQYFSVTDRHQIRVGVFYMERW